MLQKRILVILRYDTCSLKILSSRIVTAKLFALLVRAAEPHLDHVLLKPELLGNVADLLLCGFQALILRWSLKLYLECARKECCH